MTGGPNRVVLVKLALVALMWAGTFIAGRLAVAAMSPESAALWRYVVASAALAVALAVREGGVPHLSPRQWGGVVLLGVTGVFVFNLCFMHGIKTVPASRAALIVALNPAITALGAWLFFGDAMTPWRLLGSLLALFGAAIVISHGDFGALVAGGVGHGELLLVGCTLMWVAYTLLGKRVLAGLSPLAATTLAASTGTAMLAVTAVIADGFTVPTASPTAWASIVFMGLLTTAVSFVWYYEGVKAIGPARAGVFINLVPVMGVGLGALLLGESLDAATLIGGAVTVAGVWLLNRPSAADRILAGRSATLGQAKCS